MSNPPINEWKCPYCGHAQSVTENKYHKDKFEVYAGNNKYGKFGIGFEVVCCSNTKCLEVSVNWVMGIIQRSDRGALEFNEDGIIDRGRLRPRSGAKPQPDFIPEAIRDDYYEACLIINDSPKASATLSRRCIQGMIRDFCGVREDTLYKEISTLEKMINDGTAPSGVTSEVIDAMHKVRMIGNIGAHMEKDVNIIVNVEVDEAEVLVELIEFLFRDWYIARESRSSNLRKLSERAAEVESRKNKRSSAR